MPNPRHIAPVPSLLISRLTALIKSQPLERLTQDFERLRAAEIEFKVHGRGDPIGYDSRLAMASAAFRTLPGVGITQRTLHEAVASGWKPPDAESLTLLDFCAGTGPATWGAHAVFPKHDIEATLVDASLPMVRTAEHLSEGAFRTNWARNLVDLCKGLKTRKGAARFDLVLASFGLSELPSAEARDLAATVLWDAVKVGGLLVLVEGHGASGAGIVRRARETILSKSVSHDLLQGEPLPCLARTLAPCGHDKPCPLRGEKVPNSSQAVNSKPYCFFFQDTERLFAPSGHAPENRHTATFSYVAITKLAPGAEVANLPSRILRLPVKKKGQVIVDLCLAPTGQVARRVVSKKRRELFPHARKAFWGSPWPPHDLVEGAQDMEEEEEPNDGSDDDNDDDAGQKTSTIEK